MADARSDLRVYVGTRSSGENHIHCLRLDRQTGRLAPAADPHPAENPSFLVIHPNGRFLYAVNEVGRSASDAAGNVTAFAIEEPDGRLVFLNRRRTGGAAPCHVSVDRHGTYLFVANYWGGSFAIFPIEPDGRIGEVSGFVQHAGQAIGQGRDPGPHVHWLLPDPAGKHLVVADMGLDELSAYRFNAELGSTVPRPPTICRLHAGAGPRHCAFDKRGRHLFVVGELQSTINLLAYQPETGSLSIGQVLSTVPDDFSGENAAAEVALGQGGRFLYVSNRGHDSIVIFSVDPHTRELARIGFVSTGVRWPRHFEIDPIGVLMVVAGQRANALAVFHIDPTTGGLHSSHAPFAVPEPVCVRILASDDSGAFGKPWGRGQS
jgi:6-phosphogluconolactonase